MKKYNPAEIESKWLKRWEEKSLYRAVDGARKKKYYALVEFPYPSGEGLHMGHAFTNTILDVYVRKKRREGFNVLYPMGWDAFGLPTENYAIKTGIHPAEVTKKNTNRFRSQMKRLGLAYNWEREVNTTDPDYYHWTQWIFLQLFKHGLAYKKRMAINWCPSCKIGLANEEVVGGRCERCGVKVGQRNLEQWLLRITAYADRLADELDLVDYPDYVKASQCNWIGRSIGTEIKFPILRDKDTKIPSAHNILISQYPSITVFTTRPDTLFGVTAMVLAPEHPLTSVILQASQGDTSEVTRRGSSDGEGIGERRCLETKAYVDRAKKKSELERTDLAKEKTGVFTGFYCFNPINKEKVPIWIGDYVVATYGGGAVMVVPAHDHRDFAFAKKYKLPIKPVIKPSKPSTPSHPLSQAFVDYGTLVNSGKYTGLTSQKAIKEISEDLVKKGMGKRTVQYHLRDWIFSRQRYWGEPIPMIYCESCAKKGISWWETEEGRLLRTKDTSEVARQRPRLLRGGGIKMEQFRKSLAGWMPLPEDQLPLELPEVKRYQPTNTGESPLANIKDWVKTKCPHCGGEARRETDTMPNWAGSSWYYLAYVFGHKLGNQKTIRLRHWRMADKNQKLGRENVFTKYKDLINYWMPVDLYLGGAEHTTLHLLYSRFWHKFLNDIGVVPGKEPYAARRQHGVILGEDGFRMSKSRGNVVNPEEVVKKYGADALRVYLLFMGPYEATMPSWSSKGVEGAYRFLKRVWRLVQKKLSFGKSKLSFDEKFFLHKTIKKVTEDIEDLSFNTAIAALMELVNFLFKKPMKDTSREAIEALVKLLAPFAPFMSEELYYYLYPKPYTLNPKFSVHLQPWPKYNSRFIKEEKTTIVIQVNGKVRDKIEVDSVGARFTSAADKEKVKNLALGLEKIKRHLRDKKVKKTIFVPGRIINFVY